MGWDIFTLEYHHINSALDILFTPNSMHLYYKLFNFIWKMKRVSHILSNSWRNHITNFRKLIGNEYHIIAGKEKAQSFDGFYL